MSEIKENSPKEQEKQLILLAEKTRDQFISWVDTQILAGIKTQDYGESKQSLSLNYFAKRIRKSPSKQFLKKTFALVGFYNLGLTIAGLQMGLPKETIAIIWSATFFSPICEELLYRSRLMPEISIEIAKRMGMNLEPDKSRLLTNALFAVGHFPRINLDNFLSGSYLTKIANEKGLAASIASHSLINASIVGIAYLVELSEKLSSSQAETVKTALLTTLWTGLTVTSIIGIKEIFDDRQLQKFLTQIQSSDKIDKSLNIPEIKLLYSKLLSSPSTKGYKFLSGIRLAYTVALLESQEFLHQPEIRDKYALEQVEKAVIDNCKDSQQLEERLSVALGYLKINSQSTPTS